MFCFLFVFFINNKKKTSCSSVKMENLQHSLSLIVDDNETDSRRHFCTGKVATKKELLNLDKKNINVTIMIELIVGIEFVKARLYRMTKNAKQN